MTQPLVSMIVPVYNVAPYLREALDSVVSQTYRNLEILIVDDGSTDGSGAICEEYRQDDRVRVIHQENRGLSGARNTGLNLMNGDIAAFLDSDDYLYPNMVEIMVDTMVRTGADIVICDFEWNNKASGLVRKSYSSVEALKVLISGRMELAVWNKIYRREIWENIRFPEGHIFEGTRTTYKLIEKARKIEVIPDSLMYHRTRPGSIVQTITGENYREFFLASQEYEGYVKAKTPAIFSEEEYDRFFERRFREKIRKWFAAVEVNPKLAEETRRTIISQTTVNNSWGLKTKMKYEMLRFCPGMLRTIMTYRQTFRSDLHAAKSGDKTA